MVEILPVCGRCRSRILAIEKFGVRSFRIICRDIKGFKDDSRKLYCTNNFISITVYIHGSLRYFLERSPLTVLLLHFFFGFHSDTHILSILLFLFVKLTLFLVCSYEFWFSSHFMFYHLYHTLERKWFILCQLRQGFSIQLNLCLFQGWYKLRILPIVLSNSRITPLNPQGTHVSTLEFAISVGMLPRFFDTTNGNGKTVLGASNISLGVFQ